MRRGTLGNVSPAQLNTRSGAGNAGPRNGTKLSRASSGVKQQQNVAAALPPNGPRSGRSSLSRRSSSMYGKGSQTFTETRPIGDRAFQQDCIRSIVSYLTTHGYSYPVSQKTLQAPSSKDVVNVIQFLFHQIDPNWEIKKIEEDVPLVFKWLGYPVQISRSALYAAGSPISWPQLLAALTWLTNLLVAMEPSEDGQSDSPFDDQRSKVFTEYVNTCYYHFLKGDDDECAALDEEYVRKVQEENELYVSELEKLQAEANEIQEQVRKLRIEPSPLVALETKQVDYKDDIKKLNMVVTNFVSHKEALEKKRDESKQKLATKKEEVITFTKENEELRERVAAQQINAADVEKMLKEKEILQVNLNAVSSRKQDLEKTAWDCEINSSKKLSDLETIVRQFNDSCESSGDELQGQSQFELRLQPRGDTAADILGGTVKTVIKPALIELMEKSRKVLAEEINPETLNLQEELFKREISSQEKQSEISMAVARINKLEAKCKAREEKLDVSALKAEREELEARMVEEELAIKNEEAEIEHELQEIEAKFEATVSVCNEEIQQEKNTGTEIIDIILSRKESTQTALNRVHEVAAQSLEVFRDLVSSG